MENTSRVALASQMVLRRRLDLVAHNVANAGTVGFKLEGQIVQTQAHESSRDAQVAYPIDRGSFTDTRPGPLVETGNAFDIAVDGEGFLAVATPDGQRYTRDGRLSRGPDGTLLTTSGHALLSADGGALELPEDAADLTIAGDGTVFADGEEIGRIGLFRLPDDAGTSRFADGLFATGRAEALPEGRLRQGMVERSNVQPIRELTTLIELQRGYERVQNILNDEDERIRKLIDRSVRV